MAAVRRMMDQASIPPEVIAEAINFAISCQPANIDVNELIVRPMEQEA
jgi:NADP-dependent 3-hydroxy acid dehydrogenase YdfG